MVSHDDKMRTVNLKRNMKKFQNSGCLNINVVEEIGTSL